MRLNQIRLTNFRNYKQAEAGINSDLVLILGDNAAGKTNFLESLYFLSRLKSFRAPDQLLVKNLESHFKIEGQFGDHKLETIVQNSPSLRRQFKINELKTKRSLWQAFPVVLFVPNDLNLFQLGPVLRRKFLDETLSQISLVYSVDLTSLDHILKQKAALLEQIYKGQMSAIELNFWNEQLAPVAERIQSERQKFVDFINQRLTEKVNQLTGFNNQFVLQYKKSEGDFNEYQEREIRSGKNLVGPHRDDFTIEKDSQLNLFNSSRGELRTQILALKLLQAENLGQTKIKPVILLDDVFSELDEQRRSKLIENLSGHQIFITSTEEHHLPKIAKEVLILKVENNEIKAT